MFVYFLPSPDSFNQPTNMAHTLSPTELCCELQKIKNALPQGVFTVATLPTAAQGATAGDSAFVTDATAPTYNGALTGGGAIKVPVYFNGTAWTSH